MKARTRRGLVTAMVTAATGSAAVTQEPRVAALDWAWASTLVELGVTPVGLAKQRLYADWVWIGRAVIAPFESPAGLVASLIGCPYLILQLRRHG